VVFNRLKHAWALLLLGLGLGIGVSVGSWLGQRTAAQPSPRKEPADKSPWAGKVKPEHRLAIETPAGYDPDWQRPYPQYQPVGKVLKQFPDCKPGDIIDQELYRYGGKASSSYSSVDDIKDFDAFCKECCETKPKVMAERSKYMKRRYDFTGKVNTPVTMTRGKPVPVGPVVRLPDGIKSWEELAQLSARELLEKELFPEGFRPLSHPLHSVGHQLFPQMWTRIHPEHERFDVDFDFPEYILPEFPPPLFLTTRPDLGDVSRGHEINQSNFRELMDGILTPEQIEGLRLLVTKFPTTWFNQTKHRVTKLPMRGTSCFDCHVNGHTNAAIEMDPGTRPTLARVRLDTPSLRGNNITLIFSLKRSIRSTDHFSEVEEYFDGDVAMKLQLGGRALDRLATNLMGDFNSIIAFPPAPKLDRFGKLDPAKASPAELRGEKLFHGKARCATCHPAPYYTDNSMHDLRIEEFYPGRAQGWSKTFPLRGIKDSPPYFHDGRLPTLEDVVEFFNVILQTRLSADEKKDLVAFLYTL
jgi:cytochrome c peroxidase